MGHPTRALCGPSWHTSSPSGHSLRVNETEDTIEELLAACRRDHAAWINGDPSGYVLPEDGTLMAAMGGAGRGGARTALRQREGNSGGSQDQARLS
jgi:hypothetical protein